MSPEAAQILYGALSVATSAVPNVVDALANKAVGTIVETATNSAGFTIEPKIAGQMGTRGWISDSIASTIANPVETVVTQDTRFDPSTDIRRGDPATAYVNADGSYVVVNNKDGTVVQVSDRNNPNRDNFEVESIKSTRMFLQLAAGTPHLLFEYVLANRDALAK